MRKRPTNPHDRLFRALIQRPDLGPELVRSCMPPKLAELYADRPMERMPDSFVDQVLRMSQCDCLFRIPALTENDQDTFVLIEHKSDIDRMVPLQFDRYLLLIREWHARQKSARLSLLPPIISILLYHGRKPWNGPLSVKDIAPPPTEDHDFYYAPPVITLRDLCKINTETFAPHPGVQSGLAALKYSRDEEFPNPVLRSILLGIRGDTDLEILISGYIMGVCKNITRGQLEDAWQAINPERKEFLMGTILEELFGEREAEAKAEGMAEGKAEGMAEGKAEGMAEGKAEGMAEGKAKGKAEGKAELLIQMLHRRFGPLPESVEAHIKTSAAFNPDAWIDTVLEAKSVDEVVAAAGSR